MKLTRLITNLTIVNPSLKVTENYLIISLLKIQLNAEKKVTKLFVLSSWHFSEFLPGVVLFSVLLVVSDYELLLKRIFFLYTNNFTLVFKMIKQ